MTHDVAISLAAVSAGVAFCVWFLWTGAGERRRLKAQMFSDRYGICLGCKAAPIGHSSWLLAMAIVSRHPNRVAELEQLVAARDWTAAREIQEFEGAEDEVEYRLIRCPKSGEITLKKILTMFELWSNDRVLDDMRLSTEDQERLDKLAGASWELLDPHA